MPTMKELRNIVKQRGLRGYYKPRKAELEQLLDTPTQKRIIYLKNPHPHRHPHLNHQRGKTLKNTSNQNGLASRTGYQRTSAKVTNTSDSIKKTF